MEVFISWSGVRAKIVATALKKYLETTMGINAWMSALDIWGGKNWSRELENALETSNCGILCLTSENMTAPWILYEAGALSKSRRSVCPYLIGIENPKSIPAALQLFNSEPANRAGTYQLIRGINSVLDNHVDEATLTADFKKYWPKLRAALNKAISTPIPVEEDESIQFAERILELVRPQLQNESSQANKSAMRELEKQIARLANEHNGGVNPSGDRQ